VDLPIRTITEDELAESFRATETAFSHHHTDEELELERQVTEVQRCLVAVDGDRMVGTTGAYSMNLTTPGGEVPMAGITGVGVLPTHRRRGILTSLMRRQLEDIRDGGEPTAGLWASEGSIYGRFGYGPAAYGYAMSIERSRAGFAHDLNDAGAVTLADKERARPKALGTPDRIAG
jgi:predicted acetyltransferase